MCLGAINSHLNEKVKPNYSGLTTFIA